MILRHKGNRYNSIQLERIGIIVKDDIEIDRSGLAAIAAKLHSTTIDNLETIAQSIKASGLEDYAQSYANQIAYKKIENSGLPYRQDTEGIPYMIEEGEGMLVSVVPQSMTVDHSKSRVSDYARRLKGSMNGYSGIIQFLPFQMNPQNSRKLLEKNLPIAFVNMPYDSRSLERRFNAYCR